MRQWDDAELCRAVRHELSQGPASSALSLLEFEAVAGPTPPAPDLLQFGRRFEDDDELDNLSDDVAADLLALREDDPLASDRRLHRLPLRLAYLERLIRQGRTAEAAFQGVVAGMELAYLREVLPVESKLKWRVSRLRNGGRRAAPKPTPEEFGEMVGRVKGESRINYSKSDAVAEAAKRFGFRESTGWELLRQLRQREMVGAEESPATTP